MYRATLRVDFDTEQCRRVARRLRAVRAVLHCRAAYAVVRSTHHWHMYVELFDVPVPLSPLAVTAVQAILGSDPARELFNLRRALVLDMDERKVCPSNNVPDEWRSRYNVLYACKYEAPSLSTQGGHVKVNANDFGKSRPVLTADMIKGDATVLTVDTVENPTLNQDGEERQRLVAVFREFPEHAYWLNVTGIRRLVAELGDETDAWKGQRVPLVKARTQNPQTHKPVTALWVAGEEEWAEILRQVTGRGKATAKKAARRK